MGSASLDRTAVTSGNRPAGSVDFPGRQRGQWSGRDRVLLDSDASPNGLKPSQLTVVTSEGEVVEETDLTTLFELQRDVLIFDLIAETLVPDEEASINPRREYALVTDIDLDLKGIPTVDWRGVGDPKVYRLSPPWSPDVPLTLEDLEFWRPNIVSAAPRRRAVGSATRLRVENIPEATESALQGSLS